MKFLSCVARCKERFGMNHYRRAAWLEKTRKFFSTGITIFLLMASAKDKMQRLAMLGVALGKV